MNFSCVCSGGRGLFWFLIHIWGKLNKRNIMSIKLRIGIPGIWLFTEQKQNTCIQVLCSVKLVWLISFKYILLFLNIWRQISAKNSCWSWLNSTCFRHWSEFRHWTYRCMYHRISQYHKILVFSAEFLWNCALLWWVGKFTSVSQSISHSVNFPGGVLCVYDLCL
jgi:hypothetical protein